MKTYLLDFAFCRITQQGFLRIATNPRALGENALSLSKAWVAYDIVLRHPRIVILDEPLDLEQHWRDYTQNEMYSPNVWTDAYLAAFARSAGLHLVTFDGGFSRYQGLTYTHLA